MPVDIPIAHKRAKKSLPDAHVCSELTGCLFHVAIEHRCRSAIERVRQWCRRMNPVHVQFERREKRRRNGEWMDGRAHIVNEPRQRQCR